MKKTKIVVPALAVLLLSTAASVSGTVAWFSMNNKVTVTGMSVTTKVSSSILISETNADAGSYTDSLDQTREGVLEPASTVDALTYWYTVNALASGDAKEDAYVQYSEAAIDDGNNPATEATEDDWSNYLDNEDAGKDRFDSKFNAAYGFSYADVDHVCYAYIDYTFYLKATNTDSSARDLRLTRCFMQYSGGAISEKAWRVAVFSQDATLYTPLATAISGSDRKEILTLSGAANFTTGKAVNAANGLGDVSYTAAALKSVPAGESTCQKVTVRLWLEGEDTTCNNDTFVSLTEEYTLALDFSIDGQTALAANITTGA